MYRQRVIKEVQEAVKLKDSQIILQMDEKDIFQWTAFLMGPDDSPYEEGIFEVKINLGNQYPLNAPKMYFKTRIFHPNIHWETGEVCLDIIKTEWTPSWTIESLCRAVLSIMTQPNPDSPLNCDCGNLIRNGSMQSYKSMAKMFTLEYAINKKEFLDNLDKQNQEQSHLKQE